VYRDAFLREALVGGEWSTLHVTSLFPGIDSRSPIEYEDEWAPEAVSTLLFGGEKIRVFVANRTIVPRDFEPVA
jgi:hypothetical protein